MNNVRILSQWAVLLVLLVFLVQFFIPTAVQAQATGEEKCEGINCESEEAKACGSGGEGRHPTQEKQVRDDARDKAVGLVKKGLDDAKTQLQEQAKQFQGNPSLTKDLKQQLDEINKHLANIEKALKFWDRVKSAYCMPVAVSGPILIYAEAKAQHQEYQAQCNTMCPVLAGWFAKISNPKDQAAFVNSFVQECQGSC